MGVVGLAWYISGLSALLALLTSAITWVPSGPALIVRALPVVFCCGSLLSAGVAIGLGRLPPTHQARQSRSLRVLFVAAALTAMVMAIVVG